MAIDSPIIQGAVATDAGKLMPDTSVKQRVAIFVIAHPYLLRAFIKTRQFHTDLSRRMSGTVAVVTTVRKLSANTGGKRKRKAEHSPP